MRRLHFFITSILARAEDYAGMKRVTGDFKTVSQRSYSSRHESDNSFARI
jgi:hypothetical protein